MAADWYVRSGAAGTGTGADWTNAKTTLAAAATASAAGDRIFVSEDHAESQTTALTVTFPGTSTNPTHCFCVNHNGTVPPVAADLRTSATVSVGAGSVAMNVNGSAEIHGIIFNGGTNASANCNMLFAQTNGNRIFLYNCQIVLRSSATGAAIIFGGTTASNLGDCFLQGTTINIAAASTNGIVVVGKLVWKNSTLVGNPAVLFVPRVANTPFSVLVEGCDLSTCTGTIWKNTNIAPGQAVMRDCKLNASATIGDTSSALCYGVDYQRSDSALSVGAGKHNFFGDVTIETTVVRTGGATDGTTPHSWKMVTTANTSGVGHLETQPIAIWNNTVSGTIAVTIFGIAAAIPYNDELWAEAYCLVDSTDPLGGLVSNRMTQLDTHAQWTSDGSSWGGSTAPFSMTLTLSPRKAGYIYVYLKAAKASQTYYIDPKPIITSAPAISRSSVGMNDLFSGISRSRIGIGM